MSKAPYFDKNGLKKGPWSEDEDKKLRAYIKRYGHWNWRELPRFAGVSRCGKSCRLRWMNYLRPNIKHGNFTKEEEGVIMELHNKIGNKWSAIAAKLPGRSDNEIKNYWNTHLRKQAKQDKEVLKIVHDRTLESPQANPKEIPIKNTEYEVSNEVGVLLPTLSSESSYVDTHGYPCGAQSSESLSTSYYASVEFPSLMLSDSDCLVSRGDSIQPYGYEYVGDFWTEPFLVDRDSTMSNEDSCSDVVGGLISTTSCHDMVNSDEFFWSTMDLYSQYHNQFMK